MTEYDLGKVVGEDGQKGDDGSTLWYTSTAPTYANSKYTFTISNLSGKSGLEVAVNDIIFYSTYYYVVSAVNSTTVDCSTRVNIKGSDASVTIQTAWGSTTSDSKVPSEKLTKDTLDNKASSTHTHGNLTNDGKVGSNANYFVVTGTSGAITSQQKIGNIDTSGKIGSTSGKPVITTTGGTVTTGSFGTSSGTFAEGNHTHSAYVNPTKVTSWSATVSDDNVASEKLIKDTLDTKQATLVSGTNIKTVNNETLLGSGNITIQGGSSVDIVTSWNSTTSDSKVPSEKLTKTSLDDKISKSNTSGLVKNDGSIDTTSYSTFSGSYSDLSNKPSIPASSSDLSDGSDLIKTSNTSGLIKNDGSIDTTTYLSSLPSHTHGNLTNDGKVGSNANYIVVTTTGGAITSVQKLGNITYDGKIGSTSGKPVITTTSGVLTTGSFGSTSGTFAEGNHTHSGYISTSSTTGLIKNDGTVMTSGTGSSNYSAGNHTHSGYVSATKVTSWSSTVSDSNVPSEKLVKDYIDNQIGTAIQYIQQ